MDADSDRTRDPALHAYHEPLKFGLLDAAPVVAGFRAEARALARRLSQVWLARSQSSDFNCSELALKSTTGHR